MKKILCRFANYILRKCTDPVVAFNSDLYINGRTYTLIQATTEFRPLIHTNITFEVTTERR